MPRSESENVDYVCPKCHGCCEIGWHSVIDVRRIFNRNYKEEQKQE